MLFVLTATAGILDGILAGILGLLTGLLAATLLLAGLVVLAALLGLSALVLPALLAGVIGVLVHHVLSCCPCPATQDDCEAKVPITTVSTPFS
jgi:hypothetical protein